MISLRFEISKVLQRFSAVLRNYLLTSTVSLYSFSYRSGNCGMDSNDQILVNLLHLNHHETIYSIGRDLLPVSMMKRSKLIFFGIILYVLHAIHHVLTGITRDQVDVDSDVDRFC